LSQSFPSEVTVEGVSTSTPPTLKNILFLTDFSDSSEAGIPFAIAIAHRHDSKVYVLHVVSSVTPEDSTVPVVAPIEEVEEGTFRGMRRLRDRFADVAHEMLIVRDKSVWSGAKKVLENTAFHLVILCTQGRTGKLKTLPGSAHEILQRARVSVLIINSLAKGRHDVGRFHHVLFTTDLSPESKAAVRQAVSIVHANESRLLLLHVMPDPNPNGSAVQDSVANVMHQLYELVSRGGNLPYPPRTMVRYGSPRERILEVAREHNADLIVLGIRGPRDRETSAYRRQSTVLNLLLDAACSILMVPT